ncbi:MAG: hypothetical protein R3F60_21630 [bacterium]
MAAFEGDLAAVVGLLQDGADAGVADAAGRTAAFFAADRRVLAVLQAHGLRLDAVAIDGSRPLHALARRAGGQRVFGAHMDAGAEVDAPDAAGRTPLHGAAAAGEDACCHTLLWYGADPGRPDALGVTPLDVATGAAARHLRAEVAVQARLARKAAPAPALGEVLARLPASGTRAPPPPPAWLLPELAPWWEAVAPVDALGADDAVVRLWGGRHLRPRVDAPLVAIGDDGLGGTIWLVSAPVPGRQAPVIVLPDPELEALVVHHGPQLEVGRLLAQVGPLDLGDWVAAATDRRPGVALAAAIGRDPVAAWCAFRRGALAGVSPWHPHAWARPGPTTGLARLRAAGRRAQRRQGGEVQCLPVVAVPEGAGAGASGRLVAGRVADQVGLEEPGFLGFTLRRTLHLCRGLARTPGPFGLQVDALPRAVGANHLLCWGETAGGLQAWITATGEHARVLPAADVAAVGIEAAFWGSNLDVATLVAVELALAPLTSGGRLAGDAQAVIEALVGVLGAHPRAVRAELARLPDLGFLVSQAAGP